MIKPNLYCVPCVTDLPVVEFYILTIDQVIELSCEYFKISVKQICSKDRYREISVARQMVMKFLKATTHHSLKTIGLSLGRRDHATVIHNIKAATDWIAQNEEAKIIYRDYIKFINENRNKQRSHE